MTENIYDKLSDPVAFAVFVFTLMIPVAVGLIALLRTRDQSDFFVGGRSMNSITILDYFESRFKDKTRILRVTGAVIILFVSLFNAPEGGQPDREL